MGQAMNRRLFLKRSAATAVMIGVAPAALLADPLHGFADGGIATNPEPLPLVGQDLSCDYYSIVWPHAGKSWNHGAYIGGGLMRYDVHFDSNGVATIPDELDCSSPDISYIYCQS